MSPRPALSLAAVPGRRRKTLELAVAIEDAGFSGIYCPSFGDGLALCEALAQVTDTIPFGTSITPIYHRHVEDYAQTTAFIHELAPGRFRFGIGVAHAPSLAARGLTGGKPLADTRDFVARYTAATRAGDLPPLTLAALRPKMIALAGEIGSGVVFANAARSAMPASLAVLDPALRASDDFFVGNMIPTCVDNDIERARAVNRKTLSSYALLPNYRNYWRAAGYAAEMDAVERCVRDKDHDRIAACLSDTWLDDTTLAGPPGRIRDELDRWYAAGVKTPILVPSSANGGQMQAFTELFAVFS